MENQCVRETGGSLNQAKRRGGTLSVNGSSIQNSQVVGKIN